MLKNFLTIALFSLYINSDSFIYNTYNNHGVVGLINMPTARFYDESAYGISIYDGNPDQKITFTSSPYSWLEASVFYTNIKNNPLCRNNGEGNVFCQGYKDKGFNFKAKLKNEGYLPAVAIGINDIAGTGFYSSEYIVASYGITNFDFHFGLGWGLLDGLEKKQKNPLSYISDSFSTRPAELKDLGGNLDIDRYFSGKTVSPFFGLTYVFNDNLIFKLEKDATSNKGKIRYDNNKSNYSYSVNYMINDNFSFGIASERDNYLSFKFSYKNNPSKSKPKYKYKKSSNISDKDSSYNKFIKNIENNGIGVNKILEDENLIGVELTQFSHSNFDVIEEIISFSTLDSGLSKEIKKEMRIANLIAYKEYTETFEKNAELIYQRKKKSHFNNKTSIKFRPFLASREAFLKGSLLLENDSEYIFNDGLFFTSNLKYSLIDNFDDLTIPPVNTYPAQVRSDVKDYLRNIDEGIIIGRAQFDYHITPKSNHHLMFTAGILEDMFSGVGFEYLYFNNDVNYAYGFEIFDVVKRDYKMRLGTTSYSNVVSSANFYYKNYKTIPFDMKLSFGEYLAGDEGATIDFSRSFNNGTKFGIFATFTDVSSEDFGEGSFDKGVYFNIPIYQNFVNYTWRPLTKDPGARLNRKHTLYDLLSKYRRTN